MDAPVHEANGNAIGKHVGLYNNIGHIMQTNTKPITIKEIHNHPMLNGVRGSYHNTSDAVRWYFDHKWFIRIPRHGSGDNQCQWWYEWNPMKNRADALPDHAHLPRKRHRKGTRKAYSMVNRNAKSKLLQVQKGIPIPGAKRQAVKHQAAPHIPLVTSNTSHATPEKAKLDEVLASARTGLRQEPLRNLNRIAEMWGAYMNTTITTEQASMMLVLWHFVQAEK